MTYGQTGTLPSSFSSSLEESQAPLRLKAVVAGLHPLSALGGDLGGESSTTYESGVFIDTLEHEASGDLLLLLLSRGLRSSSWLGLVLSGDQVVGVLHWSNVHLLCTYQQADWG